MGEDIENHLLKKLESALQEPPDQVNLMGKLAPLKTQFLEVRDLLKSKPTDPNNLDMIRARRENLYYLNNVLADWQMISKKHTSIPLRDQISARRSIAASLKKIKSSLRSGDSTSTTGAPSRQGSSEGTTTEITTYRWSTKHPPKKVHGLNEKVMSMERQLLSAAPFKAIGIVGMAGIGKTTLCQVVFNGQKARQTFLPRIWVCLSKQPGEDVDNRKEILMRILRSLGVEEEVIANANNGEDGLKRLIFALRLRLTGKKYLLVLDDAYQGGKFYENLGAGMNLSDENWGEELKYALPKGCGGTVILSSREDALAKKMVGKEYLHYLKPVTDENIWEIFSDATVGVGGKLSGDLIELKSQILKKCDGLPLAAKMLGQIAKEQEVDSKNTKSSSTGEKHKIAHAGAGQGEKTDSKDENPGREEHLHKKESIGGAVQEKKQTFIHSGDAGEKKQKGKRSSGDDGLGEKQRSESSGGGGDLEEKQQQSESVGDGDAGETERVSSGVGEKERSENGGGAEEKQQHNVTGKEGEKGESASTAGIR